MAQQSLDAVLLLPTGDQPSPYTSPKQLILWAISHLQPYGYAQDAAEISRQLRQLGYCVSKNAVKHELLLLQRRKRPVQAPPVNSTRPLGAPPDDAAPARIIRWLIGDIPSTALPPCHPPSAFDIFRRARIRGYHLKLANIHDLLPKIVDDLFPDAFEQPVRTRSSQTLWGQNHRDVRWGIWLLPLHTTFSPQVYQFLLLLLVGRPLADPLVDFEDAPEFRIGSEWVDPHLPHTPDGKLVFARTWTADSQGISFAYHTDRKDVHPVVAQGIRLTESMRKRLQPRQQ